MSDTIPLRILTICLNGMRHLPRQYETFKKLSIPWQWDIIEGLADLQGCTSWSVGRGGHLPDEKFHKNGRSVDGTYEWIMDMFDPHVSIWEPPVADVEKKTRRLWSGKNEMVNKPLFLIHQESVLMQIDADEYWTVEQLERIHAMFVSEPDRTAAWFYCRFFVGPNLILDNRGKYANDSRVEWVRAWRFKPGYFFWRHEPPVLCSPLVEGNLAHVNPFRHAETEAAGLVFDHYAYADRASVEFKEHYYGYAGATETWDRLQAHTSFPVEARRFLPWIPDDCKVVRA
jgi:hypothetical protein